MCKNLWTDLIQWINDCFNITIILNECDIVFGYFQETKLPFSLNFLILKAKHYISVRKYNNQLISLQNFKDILYAELATYYNVSFLNGRQEWFNKNLQALYNNN